MGGKKKVFVEIFLFFFPSFVCCFLLDFCYISCACSCLCVLAVFCGIFCCFSLLFVGWELWILLIWLVYRFKHCCLVPFWLGLVFFFVVTFMHSSLIYEIMKVQGQKMIQKRAINKLGTKEIKKKVKLLK